MLEGSRYNTITQIRHSVKIARSHPRKKISMEPGIVSKKGRCRATFFLVVEGWYPRGPCTIGASDFDHRRLA